MSHWGSGQGKGVRGAHLPEPPRSVVLSSDLH